MISKPAEECSRTPVLDDWKLSEVTKQFIYGDDARNAIHPPSRRLSRRNSLKSPYSYSPAPLVLKPFRSSLSAKKEKNPTLTSSAKKRQRQLSKASNDINKLIKNLYTSSPSTPDTPDLTINLHTCELKQTSKNIKTDKSSPIESHRENQAIRSNSQERSFQSDFSPEEQYIRSPTESCLRSVSPIRTPLQNKGKSSTHLSVNTPVHGSAIIVTKNTGKSPPSASSSFGMEDPLGLISSPPKLVSLLQPNTSSGADTDNRRRMNIPTVSDNNNTSSKKKTALIRSKEWETLPDKIREQVRLYYIWLYIICHNYEYISLTSYAFILLRYP